MLTLPVERRGRGALIGDPDVNSCEGTLMVMDGTLNPGPYLDVLWASIQSKNVRADLRARANPAEKASLDCRNVV